MMSNIPSLELVVEVLNVNYGSHCYALENSPSLNGYAYLIDQINTFLSQKITRDKAIKQAVNKCIEENVLREFLEENFERVANMLFMEYDKDVEMRVIKDEVKLNVKMDIAQRMINKNKSIEEIVELTGLSYEEIEALKGSRLLKRQ